MIPAPASAPAPVVAFVEDWFGTHVHGLGLLLSAELHAKLVDAKHDLIARLSAPDAPAIPAALLLAAPAAEV